MKQVLFVCLLFLYLTKSHGQDGIDGKYYRWDCEGSYDNWAGWHCSDEEQEHLYLYKDGTAEKYRISDGRKTLISTFAWRKEEDAFTLDEATYQLHYGNNGSFSLRNSWSEHIYHFVDEIEP